MINHKKIKSRVRSYIIFSIISILMLVGAFALIRKNIAMNRAYWSSSMPMDKAIEQGYNDYKTHELNDRPVYVEISEEPVKLDYEEKHEHRKRNGSNSITYYYFYFVNYHENTYIMRVEKNRYSNLVSKLNEKGTITIEGTMALPTQRLIDTSYKEFAKTPEGAGLSKEEFLEMTGGVFLQAGEGSPAGAYGRRSFALILLVFGLYFIRVISWLIRYLAAQLPLTEGEKETIAAEMDDPRTAYIESASAYLTPRYFVYLGKELVIVPYHDILWIYPVVTGVFKREKRLMLLMRDFSSKKALRLSAKNQGADQFIGQLMGQIQAHNPQIAIGYTPQLQQYFEQLKRQG